MVAFDFCRFWRTPMYWLSFLFQKLWRLLWVPCPKTIQKGQAPKNGTSVWRVCRIYSRKEWILMTISIKVQVQSISLYLILKLVSTILMYFIKRKLFKNEKCYFIKKAVFVLKMFKNCSSLLPLPPSPLSGTAEYIGEAGWRFMTPSFV